MKIDYGEILFVGKCNFQCFYCLGHEMEDSTKVNTLNNHFDNWPNFSEWLADLKSNHVKTIYLSSTNSEPLLYAYLSELIDFLQEGHGFKVGIRTNASLDTSVCSKCKEEISLSLQSLNPATFAKITNVPLTFDFLDNLRKINNDNIRVSIVINRYNYSEIVDILKSLRKFNLRYVQLRQCYKYYETDIQPDVDAFKYVLNQLQIYPVKGNFNESRIYDVDGLSVSIWETVFKKSSISSSSYWTNGVVTNNNLLVEGYKDECSKLLQQ